MKTLNINKSNEGLLITGAKLINKENGTIAQIFSKNSEGKYNVIVNDEEKIYSFSTLQRNWQIIEEEINEETEEVVTIENEDFDDKEVNIEQALIETTEEVAKKEEVQEIQIEDSNEMPILTTPENVYIFDNQTEKQGKVNITGHIYNIPVKADKINQTTMWKVLIELYKNRKNENDIYPTEQKIFCVKTLKAIDEETFEGAYRCLVSKTKKDYIDSLLNA